MKLSEQWLRTLVDPAVSTEALAAQLTAAGFEVESVAPVAGDLRDVVVGEVTAVAPHPDAEKLTVCTVHAGRGEVLEVVCGAPNVHPGMRAPLALPGARLPGGVKIRRSRIRGVESNGMLCSAAELGLGDDADGILALLPDADVGRSLVEYLGLDDHTFDVGLTPNRGDCLGLEGVVREVGVINRCPVHFVDAAPVPPLLDDVIEIRLESPERCPRYVGRIIRNIDPRAATPVWMSERLRRSGLRSIHPVVDVTNYVMLELGQPMHAFDLERIEDRIRVRCALRGETLVLLDGQQVTLEPDALVIADGHRAVALAGIMGGLDSAVGAGTRHLLLESAFFAPLPLAGAARRHGLATDASYRFERGVSPDLQRRASERATALLLEIVGGEPGPCVDAVQPDHLPARPEVRLRPARIRRLLGIEVPAATVEDVLGRLGMQVTAAQDGWRVRAPAFRFDVAIEADLIEEIARVVGYDAIPPHRPREALVIRAAPETRVPVDRMRSLMVDRGYREVITYAFVDPRRQAELDPDTAPVPLANPISADLAVMRTSLWPGLLGALQHNVNRQQTRARLFEVGVRFRAPRSGAEPAETQALGGVVLGPPVPEQWGEARREADFYDLKADLEALLGLGGRGADVRFEPVQHPALHPAQAAAVCLGERRIGLLGALHPRLVRSLRLPVPALLFELETGEFQEGHLPGFEAISRYPAVRRDVAIIVEQSVAADAVRHSVGQAAGDMLKNLELFDVYRGEGIDSGKKSIALGLTFQSRTRTLNDAEIDALVDRVTASLARDVGAMMRG